MRFCEIVDSIIALNSELLNLKSKSVLDSRFSLDSIKLITPFVWRGF